ncbi:MAG: hypothetical protein MUE73_10360, partial [Planctomycetes bacterium]|nr:hypothetical protein [Planctomycetota bacterium]
MSRDRAPLPSHLFAVAACASAGVSGAAGPLMYLGAAALGAWALLEGFVPARVPRPLARAVDLLAASTVVLVLIARPGGLPEALRLSAQALLVAQLSRVLRRKHRGDVMAMHGIAILHLAVGAFLTRADSWLAWFCGCLVFGTVASV